MDESRPEVLMLRNVLATTAHDLGGLASALLLRADVLEHGSTDTTVRAMRSIASELRVLGQQLRALRDDEDDHALAPTQNDPPLQWSARVSRFGVGLLPRASAIECTVDDTRIPRSLAHPLWNIAIALLGAIGENNPDGRVTVHITSEPLADSTVFTLGATIDGKALAIAPVMRGPWWEWAMRQAEQHDLSLSAEHTRAVIAMHAASPS